MSLFLYVEFDNLPFVDAYFFCILLVVCLSDSILAFHRHGMQGRSLRDGTITQEITDQSRVYRLLGSDK